MRPILNVLSLSVLTCTLALLPLSSVDAAEHAVPGVAVGKSLDDWLGHEQAEYFYRGASVARQIGEGLANDQPDEKLASGKYLISGCRPHSCDEKAAVIASPAGLVTAAALMYFSSTSTDLHDPWLAIYLNRDSDTSSEAELRQWAVDALHQQWSRAGAQSPAAEPGPNLHEPHIAYVQVFVARQ
jgi:hypothetical protein